MTDGIHTLACGQKNLKTFSLKKEFQYDIKYVVGSVVLPNKPHSNLEIIDDARKLSVDGFRGVFLRETLPTKTKLNECGILNLDSSSGDGTNWVTWFKKGKETFYFDSYGVQPPSELIDYLKSPIVYNSERVQ